MYLCLYTIYIYREREREGERDREIERTQWTQCIRTECIIYVHIYILHIYTRTQCKLENMPSPSSLKGKRLCYPFKHF